MTGASIGGAAARGGVIVTALPFDARGPSAGDEHRRGPHGTGKVQRPTSVTVNEYLLAR